jgi:hypothetical protein
MKFIAPTLEPDEMNAKMARIQEEMVKAFSDARASV